MITAVCPERPDGNLGATILVSILVNSYFEGEGLSIQVTLFSVGIGTLLFHLLTKGRLTVTDMSAENRVRKEKRDRS